jgi:SAM-dependent methyltransferase
VIEGVRWALTNVIRKSRGPFARSLLRLLPRPIARWVQQLRGKPDWIQVGSVRFGDFKRLSPISTYFGFDRGTPIDRYYIEAFLSRNAGDVRGRVLEVGDNSYTLRFGGDQVNRSDILNIDASDPRATFVGDLAQPEVLPEGAFDCIVFTQVLQFIFNFQGALRTLYKALKPGGVLLLTTAGVSKMHDRWPWYWSFTPAAISRLLQNQFGSDSVSIETHGNVFVATAFLLGVASEEIDRSYLEATDQNYSIIVAARAIKRTDV